MTIPYDRIVAAIAPTGLVVRGGFEPTADDRVPESADGRPVRAVVIIGNVGGAVWPRFRREEPTDADPLDTWTRSTLRPIADSLGATYLHPSDEPFQPFQRWAQRADDVWQSPIGLLIHATYGLWHAYRGALLFVEPVEGLPVVGTRVSPCLTCADRPCLTTCPVGAFGSDGYDAAACAGHVVADTDPRCLSLGCAARVACPVGVEFRYGDDQMAFHMRAFAGMHG